MLVNPNPAKFENCALEAEVEDKGKYQLVKCRLNLHHYLDGRPCEGVLVRQGNFFANRLIKWGCPGQDFDTEIIIEDGLNE